MSLAEGFELRHGEWLFTGYSLAGITTSVYFKTAGVCFDVGQGLPFHLPARRFLITHGHLDHAAGVPYVIGQRNMQGQLETDFYVPPPLAPTLEKILRLWQEADGYEFRYRLHAAEPGALIDLGKLYAAKPFRTVHRVASQGYLVYQKKKRLKEELRAAGPDAILAARRRGEDPNESYLDPIVAFTGDTQIEFVDADPDVARAKLLFVECTFFDDAKPVEHARRWGHLHLDELIARLPDLKNERIVLIHASVRYSTPYLERILDEKLSPADRARVTLFPRPV